MFLDPEIVHNKEYHDKIKYYADCCICTGIVISPNQCEKCENCFCKTCIYNWISKKNTTCPYCREKNFKCKEASRIVKNGLSSIEFSCPDASCSLIIPYDDIFTHSKKCKKEKTACVICPMCNSKVNKLVVDRKSYDEIKIENGILKRMNHDLKAELSLYKKESSSEDEQKQKPPKIVSEKPVENKDTNVTNNLKNNVSSNVSSNLNNNLSRRNDINNPLTNITSSNNNIGLFPNNPYTSNNVVNNNSNIFGIFGKDLNTSNNVINNNSNNIGPGYIQPNFNNLNLNTHIQPNVNNISGCFNNNSNQFPTFSLNSVNPSNNSNPHIFNLSHNLNINNTSNEPPSNHLGNNTLFGKQANQGSFFNNPFREASAMNPSSTNNKANQFPFFCNNPFREAAAMNPSDFSNFPNNNKVNQNDPGKLLNNMSISNNPLPNTNIRQAPSDFKYTIYHESSCTHEESNTCPIFECCMKAFPCKQCHNAVQNHKRGKIAKKYCKKCLSENEKIFNKCVNCQEKFYFRTLDMGNGREIKRGNKNH